MIKHKKTIQFLISASILFMLTACEKNITVDLPAPSPQLVVEAYAEAGLPPYVYLSRSTAYFAPLDSTALDTYAVTGATVIVSDGSITDTLDEVYPGKGYFYLSSKITCEAGKSYSLKVITLEGETATATTTIPQPIPLDSVWFKVQQQDSLGFAWAHLTDPDTTGNCYRWFAKRLNKDEIFMRLLVLCLMISL